MSTLIYEPEVTATIVTVNDIRLLLDRQPAHVILVALRADTPAKLTAATGSPTTESPHIPDSASRGQQRRWITGDGNPLTIK